MNRHLSRHARTWAGGAFSDSLKVATRLGTFSIDVFPIYNKLHGSWITWDQVMGPEFTSNPEPVSIC